MSDQNKYVFIVQYISNGLPEAPQVYKDKELASKIYIGAVNDHIKTDAKNYREAYLLMDLHLRQNSDGVVMFEAFVA